MDTHANWQREAKDNPHVSAALAQARAAIEAMMEPRMTDIVKKLRGKAERFERECGGTGGLLYYVPGDAHGALEAADTIERLDRENVTLREALEPFAEEAKYALKRPDGPGYLCKSDWQRVLDALTGEDRNDG